jgi:hypothetical protein
MSVWFWWTDFFFSCWMCTYQIHTRPIQNKPYVHRCNQNYEAIYHMPLQKSKSTSCAQLQRPHAGAPVLPSNKNHENEQSHLLYLNRRTSPAYFSVVSWNHVIQGSHHHKSSCSNVIIMFIHAQLNCRYRFAVSAFPCAHAKHCTNCCMHVSIVYHETGSHHC